MNDTGLKVITTHINADFDALASHAGRQKTLPGRQGGFPRCAGEKSTGISHRIHVLPV